MAEYIEREDTLNIILKYFPRSAKGLNIYREINNFPAADVAEVRPGTWIMSKRIIYGCPQYMCSECKEDEYWTRRFCHGDENYCPNCGARMDKEDEHEAD